MPIIFFLSSRLLTTWLAGASCSSDNLILHTLLAWGVLLLLEVLIRVFILGQAFPWFVSSISFLRIWRFRVFMLRFNLMISAYCWLTVSRNSRISSVMPCNTLEMSVTCSSIDVKVKIFSEICKNKLLCCLFMKILEERIQDSQYRWIVVINVKNEK